MINCLLYRKLQANGFVAFDCTQQADALFIPWVYAFQADNPMQSEGASHIGLNGNLFCRVCKVHCLDLRKSAGVDQMVDSAAQFMHVCPSLYLLLQMSPH